MTKKVWKQNDMEKFLCKVKEKEENQDQPWSQYQKVISEQFTVLNETKKDKL